MPNPQAGMHGPTPNFELRGEGCMPNPQVRMHGLTNSTTYQGPGCMPYPEAGMHGPTLPNKSVESELGEGECPDL